VKNYETRHDRGIAQDAAANLGLDRRIAGKLKVLWAKEQPAQQHGPDADKHSKR